MRKLGPAQATFFVSHKKEAALTSLIEQQYLDDLQPRARTQVPVSYHGSSGRTSMSQSYRVDTRFCALVMWIHNPAHTRQPTQAPNPRCAHSAHVAADAH